MFNKKNIFFIVLFYIIFCNIFFVLTAQNTKIDSLTDLLVKANEDTSKIKILNEAAKEYLEIDPSKALQYANQAFVLSKKLTYTNGIAESFMNYGRIYKSNGSYEKAMEFYLKSMELYSITDDAKGIFSGLANIGSIYLAQSKYSKALDYLIKAKELSEKRGDNEGTGKCLVNIGIIYHELGNYQYSLENYLKAIKYLEAADNKIGVAACVNNIANIYNYLEKYDKAIEMYQQALKIYLKLENNSGIAVSYLNIGTVLCLIGQDEKAIDYYMKSLTLYNKLNDRNMIATVISNIGLSFENLGNIEKAIEYYLQSLKMHEEIINVYGMASTLRNLGSLYSEQENYPLAIEYFEKGVKLCKKDSIFDILQDVYQRLSEEYDKIGNSTKAFEYYKLYIGAKDSVMNIESINKINELQIKYETENKEKENNILIQDSKIKDLNIQNQFRQKIFFIIITVIILIIAGLLYYLYLMKRRANHLLEEQKNKIKLTNLRLSEANATKDKFFSILSHDLRGPLSAVERIAGVISQGKETMTKEKIIEINSEQEKAINKVNLLLENLLFWARSQRGMIKYNPKEIDLHIIAFRIITLMQSFAETKRIKIFSKIPENTYACCDNNMISTVLRNLISNAIKFSSEGEEILVKAADADGFVEVSVSDNGIGMCEEDIKKLFRIDVDHKTIGASKEKGTGLGLILCREFVEKNGGRIWAESQLGKGSTFAFSLHKNKIN